MMFLLAPIMPICLVAAFYFAESGGASTWSLSHLTLYIASTVRRNLPLGSSLSAYAQDLPEWRWGKRRALVDIADTVDNGMFLADALDRYPGTFPGYYRALVRAGENGGNLASVLDRLAESSLVDKKIARRVAGYSLYPAMLATVVFAIVTLLLIVMVPMFSEMFGEMGRPGSDAWFPARLVFSARTLARLAFPVFMWIAVFAFVGPWACRGIGRAVPELAAAWGWFTWHLPLVRRYERRWAVSQYALAAGRLMEAGIPTHEALEIAAQAGANRHFEAIALAAAAQVADGRKLSEALRSSDRRREIPVEFLWYVEVGETSGKLPEALLRASESAAARSRSALSRLASIVFPAGIIFIAVIVGMMAYAVFGSLVAIMEGLL